MRDARILVRWCETRYNCSRMEGKPKPRLEEWTELG